MSKSKPVLKAFIGRVQFKKFCFIAKRQNVSVSKLLVTLCELYIVKYESLYGMIEVDVDDE